VLLFNGLKIKETDQIYGQLQMVGW
jgi:hypothetical protein